MQLKDHHLSEAAKERIKHIEVSDHEDEGSDDEEEDESGQIAGEELIFNPESGLRRWLKSRGKDHCIDFQDEEMKQLRNYFNSLDDDGSGSIGVDELEDPLIALGLVDNRQQVQSIVQMVDDDGSEMIEFAEFLGIIKKGGSKSKKDAPVQEVKKKDDKISEDEGLGAIYQFFKDLTQGKMQIDGNENIPFSLFISTCRRRKIIQSMQSNDEGVKRDGEKILNNYKKQLAERLAREHAEAAGQRPKSRPSTMDKSRSSQLYSKKS